MRLRKESSYLCGCLTLLVGGQTGDLLTVGVKHCTAGNSCCLGRKDCNGEYVSDIPTETISGLCQNM